VLILAPRLPLCKVCSLAQRVAEDIYAAADLLCLSALPANVSLPPGLRIAHCARRACPVRPNAFSRIR